MTVPLRPSRLSRATTQSPPLCNDCDKGKVFESSFLVGHLRQEGKWEPSPTSPPVGRTTSESNPWHQLPTPLYPTPTVECRSVSLVTQVALPVWSVKALRENIPSETRYQCHLFNPGPTRYQVKEIDVHRMEGTFTRHPKYRTQEDNSRHNCPSVSTRRNLFFNRNE